MRAAVYTGTRNVYGDMVTSAKSLLINSNVEKIYFLAEDDDLSMELPQEIEVINVHDQKFFPWDGPNMATPYSYMALMRAALAYVFPDLDRILSLDVDTIIDKDISDIWDIPLDGYYFAACHEKHRSYDDYLYCNAGVVLFNLDKLRKDHKADEVIEVLNTGKFRWVDQDVFNYLCQGRIYDLPSDYNDNDWTVRPNAVKIKHYAGIKRENWINLPLVQKYRKIPFSEIRKKEEQH